MHQKLFLILGAPILFSPSVCVWMCMWICAKKWPQMNFAEKLQHMGENELGKKKIIGLKKNRSICVNLFICVLLVFIKF